MLHQLWQFCFRIRAFFGRKKIEAMLKEEIEEHLQLLTEAKIASGMAPEDARYAALREFGGVEQIKEQHRSERTLVWLEQIVKDFGFAVRSLRKTPGFTLMTVLILAVGIGANVTLFGWIRPFLFDPLPGTNAPDRIVAIESYADAGNATGEPLTTSFLDYRDLRDLSHQVEIVGLSRGALAVGNDRHAESAWCELVSGNFFDVMGLHPAQGRFFSPAEQTDAQNAAPVAVISYAYWRSHYSANPSAIGSTLRINQVPFTIIGVAPERFQGTQTGLAYQIWLPLTMYGAVTHTGTWMLEDRRTRNFTMLARLKPGVTIDQARDEIAALGRRMENANAEDAGVGATVVRLDQWHFGLQATLLQPIAILMAACLLLLLIVCANVANLQLARTTERHKEFSIRRALGSSSERLARLLLIESLVLAFGAAAFGLEIAQWLGGALRWLMPAVALPSFILPALAGQVVAFTFVLSLIIAAVAGLAPALRAARSNLNEMLSQHGRSGTASTPSSRLRKLLVITEVALAMVTLVGAVTFLQTFHHLKTMRPGFMPEGQVLAQFNLSTAGYTRAEADSFCQRMTERLRRVPGVTAVSYADTVPLGFSAGNWEELEIEGFHPAIGENMKIGRNLIGPGYFDTMKIPLLDGRDFNLGDGPNATSVMIVSKEFVRRFIPKGAVIGRKVHGWGRWFTIVGVASDTKVRQVSEGALPFFYIPIRQEYRPEYGLTFHIRSDAPVDMTLAAVRRVAIEIDATLPLLDAQPMTEYVAGSLYGLKIAATLLSVVGGMGVLLAAMGLYGVTAFSVARRTNEIGIRVALGARANDVFALVLREGLKIVMAGCAAGSIAAVILMRLASVRVPSVQAADPLVYIGTAVATLILAVTALAVPARRALRIDPIVALRSE